MSWYYNGKKVESIEDMPKGVFGFIYEVTHKPSGKKYIGKKQLISNRTLPPLKGQKRRRKVQKESDWKTYYGSQLEIKQLVKESQSTLDFTREIIIFASTKKLLGYYENKILYAYNVLENDDFLNNNISGKYFRRDFE